MPTEVGIGDEALSDEPSLPRASAPGAARLVPGSVVGRYVILAWLGAGGMGVVYAAHDPELDRKVALKLLRPSLGGSSIGRARLLREAQALARLAHPNVVTIHDVGTHAQQVWIAMEFIEGLTLGAWLAQQARRPAEVLAVFGLALEGVVAAHAAGLLHRDLKPDNIMVGLTGRVWVMDFGLARPQLETSESPPLAAPAALVSRSGESTRVALSTNLTEDGELVGTPAYMAPEQFLGRPIDARTDLFSLCVSLWEALYGERPFAGTHIHELCLSVTSGERSPPPRGARVPAWLRRICERGLAVDPEARFPSAAALQRALERGRARARWRIGAALGLVLAGGVGGTWAWSEHTLAQQHAACEAEGASIESVWGEATRDELRSVMSSLDIDAGPETFERVTPWLDRYASEWHEARTQACEDAHVGDTGSSELFERAQWCLDERRSMLEALVVKLCEGNPKTLDVAVPAAAALPAVAPCTDRDTLERLPFPPTQQREQIEDIRALLARAGAHQAAGSYDEALPLAQEALARAETLEWPPLVAQSRVRVGAALQNQGRFAEAEHALEDAYFEAMDAGATALGVDASSDLVQLVGHQLARPAEGLRWSRLARLGLRELDLEDRDVHSVLLAHEARVHAFAGEQAQAKAKIERALAIRERELGPEHPRMGDLFMQLAILHAGVGEFAEAKALFERVVEQSSKILGPTHPRLARDLNNLGNIHRDLGSYREAKAIHERALAIKEARLGPDHPDVAISLDNLALVLQALGEDAAAERLFERAIGIHERVHGPEHPTVAHDLINLALVLEHTKDYARARALLERALAINEKVLGPSHPLVAQVLNNLGIILTNTGDLDAARPILERAASIVEGELGPEHPHLAYPLLALAELALAQQRYADALTLAERALRLREREREREQEGVPPEERAEARAIVAKAMFESGGDRKRTWQLAREALEGFREAAPAMAEERKELEAWMAAHGDGTANP